MIEAGICPQKRKRKRKFFNKSTLRSGANASTTSYATNVQHNKRQDLPEDTAMKLRLDELDETETARARFNLQSATSSDNNNNNNNGMNNNTSGPNEKKDDIGLNKNNRNKNEERKLWTKDEKENGNKKDNSNEIENGNENNERSKSIFSFDNAINDDKSESRNSKKEKQRPKTPTPTRSHHGRNSSHSRSLRFERHKPQRNGNGANGANGANGSTKNSNNSESNNTSSKENDTSSETDSFVDDTRSEPDLHNTKIRNKYKNRALPLPRPIGNSLGSGPHGNNGLLLLMNGNSKNKNQKQKKHKNKHSEESPMHTPLSATLPSPIKLGGPSFVSVKKDDNINSSNGNENISANFDQQENKCDYPFEIVGSLIECLKKAERLSVFTIRVICELLIELVQDRTLKNNGLTTSHYNLLCQIWKDCKKCLMDYIPLPSAALETFFVDSFEEEWRAAKTQPKIDTLISNPIRILPPHLFSNKSRRRRSSTPANGGKKEKDKDEEKDKKENEREEKDGNKDTDKDKNKEKKSVNGNNNNNNNNKDPILKKLEKIRKSIDNFLHMSRMKTELIGGLPNYPFIDKSNFKYYTRLQVPLGTIAPGCLTCLVLMEKKQRKRVLFSIREPDWLILFNRMRGRAGFAIIYLAIPIHTIEGVVNKVDPRVIHLAIKSTMSPHECCIAIPNQKHKWSLSLFFDSMFQPDNTRGNEIGHKDALTALDYVQMNRQRVRRRIMTQLTKMLETGNKNDDSNDDESNDDESNNSDENDLDAGNKKNIDDSGKITPPPQP